MYRYYCYGLHIASELEMPEMVSYSGDSIQADIHIRLAWLPTEGPMNTRQQHSGLWLGNKVLRLHIANVARYEVRDGREILLTPLPGADPTALRLFLQGSALGALLMQRDYLVLHGNAIRIGDACMICVGDSGAGKSTLAAAFLKRAYDILADDVVPIRADGFAIPGFPRIKLWQDAADRLNITTTHLAPILPGMEKFNLPLLRDEQTIKPLPVHWIYVLDWHEDSNVRLEALHGITRFAPLHNNTYRSHFLSSKEERSRHFAACAKLASQSRIVRVLRPADKSLTPEQTADMLITDMSNAILG